MPAAYFLANVDVHDLDAYPDYVAAVSPTVARHGGRYLARGGATRVVEGDWTPHRVVLIAFDDGTALDAWLGDPETNAAFAIRHRIATTEAVAIEGLDGATAKGGAHLLAHIDVQDSDTFEAYREKVPAVIAQYDGQYIVRGGAHRTVEGAWQPKRLVLLEFADMAAVERFYTSPEYAPLIAMRAAATASEVTILAGVD